MNDEEIYESFREVTKSWFSYLGGLNLIKLDGTFSSDELREIARVMDEVFKESH